MRKEALKNLAFIDNTEGNWVKEKATLYKYKSEDEQGEILRSPPFCTTSNHRISCTLMITYILEGRCIQMMKKASVEYA